ncbi:MAG TPA: response regulator [Terriglobales bacterium]|nr:response regulator [Terriglobales bacterium]
MIRMALVVDDSMLVRTAVRGFLENRGYEVKTACNGLEGLAALDKFAPDLIVTDLLMPKMGGNEFIREVRYRPHLADVPIILVAGRRGSTSPSPKSGADYVVSRDVDLVEQLQFVLDKFRPAKAVTRGTKGEIAAG